ncbi:MAG: NACHT domain-containing protein [Planctomycetota bacterium]|nr:MAG: NACHT domain-containing protein [Planctomycetota bacterium]
MLINEQEIPYKILKKPHPPLMGRKDLLQKAIRHLCKITPDHISIIGPKFIGKTIFLREIVKYFQKNTNHYSSVFYWDIRQKFLENDQNFYENFFYGLAACLEKVDKELSEVLKNVKGDLAQNLSSIFELLEEEKQKILVILDGMDEILRKMSRNLWDNLRSLAEYSSLCLVTASRRRLRELCACPDSRTSDFWNIFYETPISLRPLETDQDWQDFLEPLRQKNISFFPDALRHLKQWTGGIPILANCIAKKIYLEHNPPQKVQKRHLKNISQKILEEYRDYLDEIWEDCSANEQKSFLYVAEQGEVNQKKLSASVIENLQIRGLIRLTEDKVRLACRLMAHHAQKSKSTLSFLYDAFEKEKEYEKNFLTVLQLRLEQIPHLDPELKNYIKKAIRDLHPQPKFALVWMRSITMRAFELIWQKELPNGQIPNSWSTAWKRPDKEGNPPELNPPSGKIPHKLSQQCYLLRLMCDERKAGQTRISPATFLLLDHIQSVGDLGQHSQKNIDFSFASSVCLSAVELCSRLSSELV